MKTLKYTLFGIVVSLTGVSVSAQTVVVNQKLLEQLSRNQAVRLASNKSLRDSYEDQRQRYDSINSKLTQVVAIHEFVYNAMANVDEALKQGKQAFYIADYTRRIMGNMKKLSELTLTKPQYAVLRAKYYTDMLEELNKIISQTSNVLTSPKKDLLMDPADRRKIIENMLHHLRMINGYTLLITHQLEVAERTSILMQIPGLRNWVTVDKLLVQDIINKYKTNF